MDATEPRPDLRTHTAGRTHDEAYRAMYHAFCAERGLEVEVNTDDWTEQDARDWRILVAALAKAYK